MVRMHLLCGPINCKIQPCCTSRGRKLSLPKDFHPQEARSWRVDKRWRGKRGVSNHILWVHRLRHINGMFQWQRKPCTGCLLGHYWLHGSDMKHQIIPSQRKVPSNQGNCLQSTECPRTSRKTVQIQKAHSKYFHRGILSVTSDMCVLWRWLWWQI